MSKWLKISHNGEMRYVDLPDSRSDGAFLNAVQREISCDLIEFVYCRLAGMRLCLMIDECGKLKDDWPSRVNHPASLLYASGEDCIVGDVLIGTTRRLDDGEIYVVPCEPEYYDHLVKVFSCAFSGVSFVGGA